MHALPIRAACLLLALLCMLYASLLGAQAKHGPAYMHSYVAYAALQGAEAVLRALAAKLGLELFTALPKLFDIVSAPLAAAATVLNSAVSPHDVKIADSSQAVKREPSDMQPVKAERAVKYEGTAVQSELVPAPDTLQLRNSIRLLQVLGPVMHLGLLDQLRQLLLCVTACSAHPDETVRLAAAWCCATIAAAHRNLTAFR